MPSIYSNGYLIQQAYDEAHMKSYIRKELKMQTMPISYDDDYEDEDDDKFNKNYEEDETEIFDYFEFL